MTLVYQNATGADEFGFNELGLPPADCQKLFIGKGWVFVRPRTELRMTYKKNYVMGTTDSKEAYAQDAEKAMFCCIRDQKDKKNSSRTKVSIESVAMPGSIRMPWTIWPEQTNDSKDIVAEKSVSLQDSLWRNTFSSIKSQTSKQDEKGSDLWTSAQLTTLKDAVLRSASTMRCKSPGFFALQVLDPRLRIRAPPF